MRTVSLRNCERQGLEEIADDQPNPEEMLAHAELRAVLRQVFLKAAESLPTFERQVFWHRWTSDTFDDATLAEKFDTTKNFIWGAEARARRVIQDRFLRLMRNKLRPEHSVYPTLKEMMEFCQG